MPASRSSAQTVYPFHRVLTAPFGSSARDLKPSSFISTLNGCLCDHDLQPITADTERLRHLPTIEPFKAAVLVAQLMELLEKGCILIQPCSEAKTSLDNNSSGAPQPTQQRPKPFVDSASRDPWERLNRIALQTHDVKETTIIPASCPKSPSGAKSLIKPLPACFPTRHLDGLARELEQKICQRQASQCVPQLSNLGSRSTSSSEAWSDETSPDSDYGSLSSDDQVAQSTCQRAKVKETVALSVNPTTIAQSPPEVNNSAIIEDEWEADDEFDAHELFRRVDSKQNLQIGRSLISSMVLADSASTSRSAPLPESSSASELASNHAAAGTTSTHHISPVTDSLVDDASPRIIAPPPSRSESRAPTPDLRHSKTCDLTSRILSRDSRPSAMTPAYIPSSSSVRQSMLTMELPESLRKNLLWERVKNRAINTVRMRKRAGSSHSQPPPIARSTYSSTDEGDKGTYADVGFVEYHMKGW